MTVRFNLTIASGNAALVDDPPEEVARILRDVVGRVLAGHTSGVLMDINGNGVGDWDLEVGP